MPAHVAGSILPVTSCADDGSPGTFRSVASSVLTGDTIDLSGLTCGTITIEGGYVLSGPDATDFSIIGPGADALTITGNDASGVFYAQGGGLVSISDLTLAHGYADDSWGGCLLDPGGGLSLERVVVSDCEAHQVTMQHGSNTMGGGITAFGALTIVDSVISDNSITSELADAGSYANALQGGGAFSLMGPVTVTRSRIAGNHIDSTIPIVGWTLGAGISVYFGDLAISDSEISGNVLSSMFVDAGTAATRVEGGGIQQNGTYLAIDRSTFDGNSVSTQTPVTLCYGGGIETGSTNAIITSSTISNNTTNCGDAGISDHAASLSIVDSTLSGNHSASGGGGMHGGGALTLANSTVAFNISDAGTGGVETQSVTTLTSSIIASNTGGGAMDVAVKHTGSFAGDHSLVMDPGSVALPPDTIIADPRLAALAANGGPTWTHALPADSPAIDVGSNPLALRNDQRGEGFDRTYGAGTDIGAFELQPMPDEIFANGFESGP
jgi:hypothetical protein